MRLIEQSWSWEQPPPRDAVEIIENAARTCYQSEPQGKPGDLVQRLIKLGHHSVLEHVSASVRIVTNRGVSHELVRHRLTSYSQESTRYCNYGGKEIEFIKPVWEPDELVTPAFWYACQHSENTYNTLLQLGWRSEQAREVLPNALKTEIVMTCNLREWRHFFTLRCSPKAHPQMRALATSMLVGFQKEIPIIFDIEGL